MKIKNSINIDKIDSTYNSLVDIKSLWRKHADTLGYFPDGAFDSYADKQQILIAKDSSENFLGYLLYRITQSRNDANIVHLCVNKSARNLGVATLLVKKLIDITKTNKGIGLSCRRDFEANNFWPKLGFLAISERFGKSKSGSTLTRWWYDHKIPDLFSAEPESQIDDLLRVAIDANVFFDLKDQSNFETMALNADWLDDIISIWISDEIYNEIHRASIQEERNEAREFVKKFTLLTNDAIEFEQTFSKLKKHLPPNPSNQDHSDLKHLAKAIVANVDFYITRDDAVLRLDKAVYEEFGIPILRPSDLIIHIDALHRESKYKPARLAGTLYRIVRVPIRSEDRLVKQYQNHAQGEKQTNFKDNLRKLLSSPHDIECHEALDQKSDSIGLIAYNKQNTGILKIELLRALKKHSLSKTMIRYLIGKLISRASIDKCYLIQIADQFLDSDTITALKEDHFVKLADSWFKLLITDHLTSQALTNKLKNIGEQHPYLENHCTNILNATSEAESMSDKFRFAKIEAAISPGLVSNSSIPCFIVPIKPYWALQLFDEKLAEQDLFGAKVELALSRELVYYRSTKNSFGIAAPARIIWYVSSDDRYPGSGSLRAYSRLDQVIKDKPKTLFKQFRRLGIYEWENVLSKAKNNIDNQLMAIIFSNTTLLQKPLKWNNLKEKLSEAGIKTQLQCPCPIPENLFFTLIS